LNFSDQSEVFLASRTARNRNPVKESTMTSYRSRIKNHILPAIGPLDLEGFSNGALKLFAQGLSSKGLAPKTILETVVLVKQIVASAVSPDGDYLYPRHWNHQFIDLPPVTGQKQPTVSPAQLAAALADKRYGLFYALLAGTGMRIGEALGLRYGQDGVRTGWSPDLGLVDVCTGLWRNQEGSPKTLAAVRQIDLHPDLNVRLKEHAAEIGLVPGDYLFQSSVGSHICESSLRRFSLAPLNIEGFHSFRRWRVGILRGSGCPEDMIRFWIGHTGISQTDIYNKIKENIPLRKKWATESGLGFSL
jgi:integrase